MQPTRQHILDYLRVHRDASVRELGSLLGLTATGVRQHLGVLEQEGYIQSREQRGRVGRPALRYALTAHGEDSYPRQYHQLANALIAEVEASFGPAGLTRIAQGVARRFAATLDVAPGATPAERAEALTIALRARGVVADWSPEWSPGRVVPDSAVPGATGPGSTVSGSTVPGSAAHDSAQPAPEPDAILIYERTCPYPQVARLTSLVCTIDVEQVGAMTGMHAELTTCIAGGDDCCTFRLVPPLPSLVPLISQR